jgi:hypothetical protein
MTPQQAQDLRDSIRASIATCTVTSEDFIASANQQDCSDMLNILYGWTVPTAGNAPSRLAWLNETYACLMASGHTIDGVVGARPKGIRGSR